MWLYCAEGLVELRTSSASPCTSLAPQTKQLCMWCTIMWCPEEAKRVTKRLAGYCNAGFRKSDEQAQNVQFQVDEVSKQQDIKFLGALRMAKVEVETADHNSRTETGSRQRKAAAVPANTGENPGGTQSDHCSSQAFGIPLCVPIYSLARGYPTHQT